MNTHPPCTVLVVDDSAVVRESMSLLLTRSGHFRVISARDPIVAAERLRVVRPDVILLDLEMPRQDGLSFLRQVMASGDPLPVVVLSALTGAGTDAALTALEEGAVDVITKPRLDVKGFLEDSVILISDALRAAASVRAPRARTPILPSARLSAGAVLPAARLLAVTTDKLVAVGASTGGTEALRRFLTALPPSAPGIVVVQHMPERFTRAFAARLDAECAVTVREAAHLDSVIPGRVLVAPGNRQTRVRRSGANYIVEVVEGPLVSRHRPSVDVLFRSVAESAGANAAGVIMTGMGDDGAAGLLEMHHAGALSLAQDEASCVVFGMPKEAIRRGAVDEVVALDALAARVMAWAGRPVSPSPPGGTAPPSRPR
ncbi:MAG: chemotaxis response regulator protein-glutamate methylesterase [Deltaproteobacteria bacterium]|nr:chemotaxis response regulator protein-glutamate methylesterase [Deltaproteobacteria bacterium]